MNFFYLYVYKFFNIQPKEPMKCTGKFKDDFDTICTLKNIKYVPDVVARSKRPGSALQNVILQQVMQQQQQEKSDMMSSQAGKKNAGKSKANLAASAANLAQNTTTAAAADSTAEHELEQNPGILLIFNPSVKRIQVLLY